ncbi:MAG: MBL fold metallo-hydrolase [Lachnospiraceae bacterium]|nr:MBL fold metallo-hydrolase [Lachnospiraceae bacterium]
MEEKFSYFSAEEIADGSYKIFNNGVERPFAYCYLVVGENYALLIDSIIGLGNVKKFCETLTDKKIVLVNTHAHTDHIGGNFFFDSCYIHPRDMALAASSFGYRKEQLYEMARQNCPEEYRDRIVLDDNFADWDPIKMLPVYDGDEFDLGDRIIEVAEAAGHTEGSIILIDHKTRIAYSGDACNGSTLLEFDHSLPIIDYMKSLVRLKERQGEFDMMYGGHEIYDSTLIDEAIETVARVLAGTDDHVEADGMMGGKVCWAAKKKEAGYGRADGKRFNMSYNPGRVSVPKDRKQVIKL